MTKINFFNFFAKKIKSKRELLKEIVNYQKKYSKSYLNFLLSLHPLIIKNKDKKTDFNFISQLIFKSFTTKPIEFNLEWKKRISPTINKLMTFDENNIQLEINLLLETIEFQAAELKSMEGKQLENPNRFFGVESDQNNTWYNFEIIEIFSCGMRGLNDNDSKTYNFSWINLAQILEMGRIYE